MPISVGNDQAFSSAVQSDGKIVIAGNSSNSSGTNDDFSVVRLNVDGSLDTSFNGTGKLIVPVGTAEDQAFKVAVLPSGKIVVTGWSLIGSDYDFSAIRLNSDGSLDTTFGGVGKVIVPVGIGNDISYSAAVQSDGKIVISGTSVNGSGTDFSAIRLNIDGTLDSSFGDQGGTGNTLGGTISYTEHALPVALDASVAVLDADLAALASGAGDYAGSSVTLARVGGANAQDQFSAVTGSHLSFTAGNAVLSGVTVGTVSNANGSLAISFNHSATQAVVNEVLSSIAYANSSSNPPASVQIGWTFNDGNTGSQGTGGALTGSGSSTINITAVNDTPTITGIPTTAQTVTAGTPAALADFTVADVDSTNLTVTLTTINGTLNNLTDADAITPGIQLTGTTAAINTAIAGATFTATAAGAASIGVSVSDATASTSGTYTLTASAPVSVVQAPVGASSAGITLSPTTPTSAAEGTAAIASFNLSAPLAADAQVNASITAWGATPGADSAHGDFYGFDYRMVTTTGSGATATTTVGTWTSVPTNGLVTITHGATGFDLRTHVNTDNISPEPYETLVFVVSQAASSTNLTNSWWVQAQVDLTDVAPGSSAGGAGGSGSSGGAGSGSGGSGSGGSGAGSGVSAGAASASITASPSTPTAVAEGSDAIASFNLSAALAADAQVNVSITGWGATAGADLTHGDYTGFDVRMVTTTASGTTTGSWTTVPASGLVTITHGATSFDLRTHVNTDSVSPEAYESLVFVVSQAPTSTNLTSSWWVQSQINLTDVAAGSSAGGAGNAGSGSSSGSGASSGAPVGASSASITANAANATTALEGTLSVASFNLSAALAADAQVNASITAWGATPGVDSAHGDFYGFDYRMVTTTGSGATATTTLGNWTSVPTSGLVNITHGATGFDLSTHINTDNVGPEAYETIVFIVGQAASSSNLTNSWWVQQQVDLLNVG